MVQQLHNRRKPGAERYGDLGRQDTALQRCVLKPVLGHLPPRATGFRTVNSVGMQPHTPAH